VLALVIAGCGSSTRSEPVPKPGPRPLVYMSRNTLWAVPDDVTVYSNGRVDYRQLLHTKISIKVRRAKLSPAALSSLQRLVAGTRLAGADRAGSAQPRNGFTYLLRINGRSITTRRRQADGGRAAADPAARQARGPHAAAGRVIARSG
jgi:hypothetical protein